MIAAMERDDRDPFDVMWIRPRAARLGGAGVKVPPTSSHSAGFSQLQSFTDLSTDLSPSGAVTSAGSGTGDGQSVQTLKGRAAHLEEPLHRGYPQLLQLGPQATARACC